MALGLTGVIVAVVVLVRTAGTQQHGAHLIRFSIHSRRVDAVLPVVAVVPPGRNGAGRPLLVFLHGRGLHGQDANLDEPMFKALAAQGSAAPDIVFPNGGVASYWHNRASGRWADYVIDEVIPIALRRLRADPRRVAIAGISMGGFGALDLARRTPGRFCAIGATSAALGFAGAATPAGAFDDAQDFARHDLLAVAAATNPFGRTPVWMDVGNADPFLISDRTLAARLRTHGADLQLHVWPGAHTDSYWQAHWRDTLRFYSAALANCRR